jgi:outer membrane protein
MRANANTVVGAAQACRRSAPWRHVLVAICLASAGVWLPASSQAQTAASELTGVLAPTGLALADCPTAAPAGPLTLEEAQVRALCQHPSTRVSWTAVRASAAEASLQAGGHRPVFEAGLGAGRALEHERSANGDRSRAAATVGRAAVDMQWVLYDFGQRNARSQAAEQALAAARSSHQAALQQVMLDTAEAYFTLLQAVKARALVRESERFTRELLAMSLRPRKGITAIDRLGEMQARTALASLVLDLRRADAQVSRSRGELASRLGLSPMTPIDLPVDQLALPDAEFAANVATLMDQAQAEHPQLQAARARLGSAQAGLAQAQRINQPVLRATASAGRSRDVFTTTLSERRVGLQVDIPLFAGREQRAQVHQAQAQLDEARANLQQAQQDSALAVWVDYQNLREELAALQMAERWRHEAEALLSAETAALMRDDSDMFDVLDAHDSVMSARSSMLDSETALAIGRFRLGASLGRMGWPLACDGPGRVMPAATPRCAPRSPR